MLSVFAPSESSLKKVTGADPAALPESAVWIDLVKPTAAEDKAVERLGRIGGPRPGGEAEEAGRTGHAKRYSDILIAIGRKGDLTSKVRESLVSIGRVVTFVAAAVDGVKWSKDMREQLKTMQRDVISLTDHASYLSNKITFVLDAMLGVVNLEQNNIIKLFSVMAVGLMPPTLIASIYAMNFKIMPELEWVHGYPYALVAMLLAAVGPYLFLQGEKWLQGWCRTKGGANKRRGVIPKQAGRKA